MSELIDTSNRSANARLRLLTTVSVAILMGTHCVANASDDESDRPTVWIELGGQLDRMSRYEDTMSPPFAVKTPRPGFETDTPASLIRPPRYAVGGEGELTFQPRGSDWVFTASVRYGRSNSGKLYHHQTYDVTHLVSLTQVLNPGSYRHVVAFDRFLEARTQYRESHSVVDFAAGRDVGLGLFGEVTAALGVRYAQFAAASTGKLAERPDFHKQLNRTSGGKYFSAQGAHFYSASITANRGFHGVGPSLSVKGTKALWGKTHGDAVTFDWGLNGALLFGRQRAAVTHTTYGVYHAIGAGLYPPKYHNTNGHNQSRAVTVPNIGGFAGVSVRYPNARLSLGYRADLFFGAMDGGVDDRKSFDRSFYGPFATISIGLGG